MKIYNKAFEFSKTHLGEDNRVTKNLETVFKNAQKTMMKKKGKNKKGKVASSKGTRHTKPRTKRAQNNEQSERSTGSKKMSSDINQNKKLSQHKRSFHEGTQKSVEQRHDPNSSINRMNNRSGMSDSRKQSLAKAQRGERWDGVALSHDEGEDEDDDADESNINVNYNPIPGDSD